MAGRKCSICGHKKRGEIEKAIQDGISYRNISERFSISLGSISRHKEHISAPAEGFSISEQGKAKRNKSGTGLSEAARAARREYKRKWTEKNKEAVAEYHREYAAKHKEERNKYYREYMKKHPGRKARYNASYWERKAAEQGGQP